MHHADLLFERKPLLVDREAKVIMREIDADPRFRATSLSISQRQHLVYAHDLRDQTKTEIRSRADWDRLRDGHGYQPVGTEA